MEGIIWGNVPAQRKRKEEKYNFAVVTMSAIDKPGAGRKFSFNKAAQEVLGIQGEDRISFGFTPDGKHIIFCSNHEYKRGFPFNMYLIDLEGKGLEKISRDKGFDAFPMFSPDGKKIIFASNRNNGGTRDTNLFVADWVE